MISLSAFLYQQPVWRSHEKFLSPPPLFLCHVSKNLDYREHEICLFLLEKSVSSFLWSLSRGWAGAHFWALSQHCQWSLRTWFSSLQVIPKACASCQAWEQETRGHASAVQPFSTKAVLLAKLQCQQRALCRGTVVLSLRAANSLNSSLSTHEIQWAPNASLNYKSAHYQQQGK